MRYAEPQRVYHREAHITAVLGWFDWVATEVGWDNADDVFMAIVFHDSVYDPLAKDNEARSAQVARKHGASKRAIDLIMLTAGHGDLTPSDVDREAALFHDCDIAIFGASAEQFDVYDAGIAMEQAGVPSETFTADRRRFLVGMLTRPRIFLSDLFNKRFGATASANVARMLARY